MPDRQPKHRRALPHFGGMIKPITMAFSALEDAHYHVFTIDALLRDPDFGLPPTGTVGEEPTRVSIRYHAHLRAFFWELTSAFEMLLHHVDSTFTLNVSEKEKRSI